MVKGTSVGRKQEVNGDYLYVSISTYSIFPFQRMWLYIKACYIFHLSKTVLNPDEPQLNICNVCS